MADIKQQIADRIKQLKKLGAGDAQCVDCLSMGVESLAICKKCIADTPAFNDALNKMLRKE